MCWSDLIHVHMTTAFEYAGEHEDHYETNTTLARVPLMLGLTRQYSY